VKLTADLHESSGAISCIDWLSIRHYVCCFAPNSILCTGLRNREEKNWSHCCSNIGSRTPVISTPTFCSGDRDGYPRGMYEIFHAWKICQVIRPFLSNKRIYVSFHFIFFFSFQYRHQCVKTNSLSFESSNYKSKRESIVKTRFYFSSRTVRTFVSQRYPIARQSKRTRSYPSTVTTHNRSILFNSVRIEKLSHLSL